jgi:hypothetical protein
MRTLTGFIVTAALLLAGTVSTSAKSTGNNAESGISFPVSGLEQATDIVSISPDAASKAATLDLLVNSNSRIRVPGVMMNVIEFNSLTTGGQKVRFKLKNAAQGIYYLTVAPAGNNWHSTMTLQ